MVIIVVGSRHSRIDELAGLFFVCVMMQGAE